MFKRILSAMVLLLCLGGAARAQTDLTLYYRGKLLKRLTLKQLQQVAPPRTIKVYEPHEGRDRSYRVVPFLQVLEKIYGNLWNDQDELLFTALDGYQPSVPGKYLSAHQPLLAFASGDGKPFRLSTQHASDVAAGPYYLIWENLEDVSVSKDNMYFWPYQVIKIDVIQFSKRFPRMSPPEDAPVTVRQGFDEFRARCMMCHSINGDGGPQIELNYPVNISEYFEESWLESFIKNPQSVRHNAKMLPMSGKTEERERVAKVIVAYLKAMKTKKIKPQS